MTAVALRASVPVDSVFSGFEPVRSSLPLYRLAIQDLEGLLEGRDLLLPARDTVVVRYTDLHTGRLELVEVRQRGVELRLVALEVLLCHDQRLLLILLLVALILDLLLLGLLVGLRIGHEGLVLLLSGLLRSLRLGLQAREVGLDHLQHAHDVSARLAN